MRVRLERLDGRVLSLELETLPPVLDLAPPFLGDTTAKGPFTTRDMARFVLVEEEHFFDLDADPLELTNLSPSGTAIESTMHDRLIASVEAHDRALETANGDGLVIDPEVLKRLRALGYLR